MIIVSDTTESGATYAIDGLLLETENDNQPLLIFAVNYIFAIHLSIYQTISNHIVFLTVLTSFIGKQKGLKET